MGNTDIYKKTVYEQKHLSRRLRTFLANEGIHDMSSLQDMSVYEFLDHCRFHTGVDETIDELVACGIMQEMPGEIKISDLNISSRLRNCLHRAYMRYLSQVTKYSQEDLLKLRNLGVGTLQELLSVCDEYGIKVWSVKDMPDEIRKYGIHPLTYANWYADGIVNLSDLEDRTPEEILDLCGGNKKTVKKILGLLNKKSKK